jgi:hypothetical protein
MLNFNINYAVHSMESIKFISIKHYLRCGETNTETEPWSLMHGMYSRYCTCIEKLIMYKRTQYITWSHSHFQQNLL